MWEVAYEGINPYTTKGGFPKKGSWVEVTGYFRPSGG